MNRADVTSGAAFRAALRATVVLIGVLLVASLIAFTTLRRELTAGLEVQIADDRALLEEIYERGGDLAVIGAIDALKDPLQTRLRAVGLFDTAGRKLAGNIDLAPAAFGWRRSTLTIDVPVAALPPGVETADYYFNVSTLGRMILVVGRDLTLVERQERRMLQAFLLLGVVVSGAFLSIGYFASRQTLQKLERMAATLERVSQGDNQARLEVRGDADQIDRIAHVMNRHLDRLSDLIVTTRASAAAIAHDLQTPMSRAFLSLDRALRDLDHNADPRPAIEDIAAELARLRSIFDAILRISRLETDEGRARFGPVALAGLLEEMAETFAPLAEERGQHLTLEPVAADLRVEADEPMLAQLVANLVQNAIGHCPAGTCITLSAAQVGPEVVLTVRDTGPGIPAAERERVFEMFYRIDPNRTGGGNGLGMALVKAIAQRLGASVRLLDASPGLRVEVVFPGDGAPGA